MFASQDQVLVGYVCKLLLLSSSAATSCLRDNSKPSQQNYVVVSVLFL